MTYTSCIDPKCKVKKKVRRYNGIRFPVKVLNLDGTLKGHICEECCRRGVKVKRYMEGGHFDHLRNRKKTRWRKAQEALLDELGDNKASVVVK